jgi:hypothetical protein
MDRVDLLTLSALTLLAVSFCLYLRWRRALSSRIEQRTVRSLKLALQRRTAI